jgi:hypothetical protein
MKTMTCKQLGGACEVAFQANTFEEMAELSKQHGMEMFAKADQAHLKVMQEVQALLMEPAKMQAWMDEKRSLFDALPEDK